MELGAGWIGKQETRCGSVEAHQAQALAAVLDRANIRFAEGEELPLPWHWLYLLPDVRQSEIGNDGHPRLGGFLPPLPLSRRMWASGSMQVDRPLRVGQAVARTTTIESVDCKHGRTGEMYFVTLRHEIHHGEQCCIRERQHLVYRGAPQPGPGDITAPEAARDESWSWCIEPDPVLLFRYSALTFNAHRIHYDRDYAMQSEYYPGLVVQGPLIATLLLELLYRELPGRQICAFSFRAVQPIFDHTPFTLCGRPGADGLVALWARRDDGVLAMEASAQLL